MYLSLPEKKNCARNSGIGSAAHWGALILTAVFAVCAGPMQGQTANSGAISGTVTDPSGGLVPRAAVVMNRQATGEQRSLVTNFEGGVSFQFLAPGTCAVTVRAAGFEPIVVNDIPGADHRGEQGQDPARFAFCNFRLALGLHFQMLAIEGISAELDALLSPERSERPVVLSLKDLTLVSEDAIVFLSRWESNGIKLENCPPYVREWINRHRQEE